MTHSTPFVGRFAIGFSLTKNRTSVSPQPPMPTDLTQAAASRASARAALEACIAAATPHAFVRRFDDEARHAADRLDREPLALPLAGLAISVKDLYDVQGWPTTAGSTSRHDAPAAGADAPAVARLRTAGGVLVGHTNLTEFAFSGVGINPHFGTPANPATAALDAEARIPGGSTSGGAVSVASGAAWAALGSDTGGSIRIPAALQGLVGFKNTQRLTPTEGCIPLSTTLDTACAITLSVRDAARGRRRDRRDRSAIAHRSGAAATRRRHPGCRELGLAPRRAGDPTSVVRPAGGLAHPSR
jgi:aspartyl-tRNA(Asn)/glutamyl-tRNA(Gln) amidotransferase subunit A